MIALIVRAIRAYMVAIFVGAFVLKNVCPDNGPVVFLRCVENRFARLGKGTSDNTGKRRRAAKHKLLEVPPATYHIRRHVTEICAWPHLYYHLSLSESDRLRLLVKMFPKLIFLVCGPCRPQACIPNLQKPNA